MAKLTGLYPEDPKDAAFADMVVFHVTDFMDVSRGHVLDPCVREYQSTKAPEYERKQLGRTTYAARGTWSRESGVSREGAGLRVTTAREVVCGLLDCGIAGNKGICPCGSFQPLHPARQLRKLADACHSLPCAVHVLVLCRCPIPSLPPCAPQLFMPTWTMPAEEKVKARQDILAGKGGDKLKQLEKIIVRAAAAGRRGRERS